MDVPSVLGEQSNGNNMKVVVFIVLMAHIYGVGVKR